MESETWQHAKIARPRLLARRCNGARSPQWEWPPQDAGGIGYITWSRIPKGFKVTTATTAEYIEERIYRAQDEDSKYGLDLKINQLPP